MDELAFTAVPWLTLRVAAREFRIDGCCGSCGSYPLTWVCGRHTRPSPAAKLSCTRRSNTELQPHPTLSALCHLHCNPSLSALGGTFSVSVDQCVNHLNIHHLACLLAAAACCCSVVIMCQNHRPLSALPTLLFFYHPLSCGTQKQVHQLPLISRA